VFRQVEQEFIEALQASELPATHDTLAIMGRVAKMAADEGLGLTKEQLVQETREYLAQQHQSVTRGMKGEALIKHLGPEVVNEVIRYNIEKVKRTPAPFEPAAKVPPSQEGDSEDRAKKSPNTISDLRKMARGL
jgi:hypothetical protein